MQKHWTDYQETWWKDIAIFNIVRFNILFDSQRIIHGSVQFITDPNKNLNLVNINVVS